VLKWPEVLWYYSKEETAYKLQTHLSLVFSLLFFFKNHGSNFIPEIHSGKKRQLGQVDRPGYLAKLIDQVAL
jgi:hypothetical protein